MVKLLKQVSKKAGMVPLSYVLMGLSLMFSGCVMNDNAITETPDGYQLPAGTELAVTLRTPLNSNLNIRGDSFNTHLKHPLRHKNKIILPEKTEVRGLVKRVTTFKTTGDQAVLVLIFDQILMSDARKIPFTASINREKKAEAVQIKGTISKKIRVVNTGTLIGYLVRGVPDNTKTGQIIIGSSHGTGVVLMSHEKEIRLPQGTEFNIKIDHELLIPRL